MIGTDATPDRADTSLLRMECEDDDGDEEEDHQDDSSGSGGEDEETDAADETTVRKYRIVNLHIELEDQEDIINSLERGGAKRGVPTPVPQTLLSLD